MRIVPAVFGEEENRGVLLSPISKPLYCPSARTAQHLGAVAEEDLHLIGRKDFLHDAAAELGMIDNIARRRRTRSWRRGGRKRRSCSWCAANSAPCPQRPFALWRRPGHGGGRCGGRGRRRGGLEGIHGLLAGLTAFTRQTAVFPFASLGVAGG